MTIFAPRPYSAPQRRNPQMIDGGQLSAAAVSWALREAERQSEKES